jgi:hypothetical protein
MYLELLEKQEQAKPQISTWKKKQINEIETKKLYKESRKWKVSASKRLINA